MSALCSLGTDDQSYLKLDADLFEKLSLNIKNSLLTFEISSAISSIYIIHSMQYIG